MKFAQVLPLALIGLAVSVGAARAGCFPVKSDVVSLGEKAARFYAERSLAKAIDEQKGSIESSGTQLGRVTKGQLNCQPFPNLIGADEWRCVGEAKLCTGTVSSKADAGSRRGNATRQKAKARSKSKVADAKK